MMEDIIDQWNKAAQVDLSILMARKYWILDAAMVFILIISEALGQMQLELMALKK